MILNNNNQKEKLLVDKDYNGSQFVIIVNGPLKKYSKYLETGSNNI
jgi:hypothetical protein